MHCRILAIVYKRYIDYIFVIFNSYLQLLKFVDYMNHQHPNIKFTFEVEKNNNSPFLDVKICRENNQLTTSVFRKPTFCGAFINFDSFLHVSYKHSLVNTLIFRCFKMCFSNEKLHNEIAYHKEILGITDTLIILLIFALKFSMINFILPKNFIKWSRKSNY